MRTVGTMFFDSVAAHGDVVAVRNPRVGDNADLTYDQLAEKVRALAAGLLTLGFRKGNKVALFSDNHPLWIQSDLAMQSIGVIDVPRGSDSSILELDYILRHSECGAVFVQDQKLYDKIRPAIAASGDVRNIVMMDDSSASCSSLPNVSIQDFSTVEQLGRTGIVGIDIPLETIQPQDPATIIYTSGTTGQPKGVMLTHVNLTHQSDNIDFGGDTAPGDILQVLLPSWHAYERAVEYVALRNGWTLAYSDKRSFRDDMISLRPHIIPCVPRVWEMVYDGVQDKLKREPEKKQRVARGLLSASQMYVRMLRIAEGRDLRRKPASRSTRILARMAAWNLQPIHRIADKKIYGHIRKITGGRVKAAVSGGGSLAPYIDDFFEVIGVRILNGYGLTETSPVLSLRQFSHNVRGSVGQPIAKTEISIRDEDGESLPQGSTGVIWVRGPQIMLGYYKNPEGTKSLLDAEGWLNTGDLGWIATTGDLVISGRAKDTIVLSSGENVEPDNIEVVARRSALVSQIIVIGQDKKNLAALVIPHWPALATALGTSPETPPGSLIKDPRAARIVREDISDVMNQNGGFKSCEFVHRVALLDYVFSDENETLTQTMKLRRRVILEKFAVEAAALYQT
ncbi:long-chain fatty acid--CoA ligase [candidate division BRC1 bacterium HGW-BRC1-1]|nr:MAG: long-chain fatty acid--CoA ligase [candidate division BRC1 bacterium HGW-BRC1-1]